jgi:hypothetical protein
MLVLVCNLRPGDYLPTYPPKLGSHLPKLGSHLPLASYLPPQGVRNDPQGPRGGGSATTPRHRPTGLSLRQLRTHALALRLQHGEALCGRQRRKVELLRLKEPRRLEARP